MSDIFTHHAPLKPGQSVAVFPKHDASGATIGYRGKVLYVDSESVRDNPDCPNVWRYRVLVGGTVKEIDGCDILPTEPLLADDVPAAAQETKPRWRWSLAQMLALAALIAAHLAIARIAPAVAMFVGMTTCAVATILIARCMYQTSALAAAIWAVVATMLLSAIVAVLTLAVGMVLFPPPPGTHDKFDPGLALVLVAIVFSLYGALIGMTVAIVYGIARFLQRVFDDRIDRYYIKQDDQRQHTD
jgi:hypothetical protein